MFDTPAEPHMKRPIKNAAISPSFHEAAPMAVEVSSLLLLVNPDLSKGQVENLNTPGEPAPFFISNVVSVLLLATHASWRPLAPGLKL
eukprot:CAMPEP_0172837648 /NCGR_PEP_ID=MMETSP1075-20121228/27355_1 /TAXON_ID=2916 /ORGANISM="Ceratium fusus, Strain PA161109" /LENGTH=87 /DNA_ID=CAMNT_0013681067 /DNA_START=140 /DNA_END=403 /DNA_ORIENTATION=+